MHDMTTGSVTRHLLKTTGFMLVTMIAQTLYILVDLYWVGRLGKEAVAAVSVAGNLAFIVLAVTQMLSVGATTRVSHAVGRKDYEGAIFSANQSHGLGIACGLLFLSVAMTFRDAYATGLSADARTAQLAGDYLLWFIPAMALQFPMVSMSAALRGTGNFRPGMIVQTSTVVINMLLAPLLIFGVGTGRPLGVAGAALATLISIAIGTVWLMTYFRHGAFLQIRPSELEPHLPEWLGMLKVGLPAGAEFALMSVYMLIVLSVSRPFGAAAQAGFGIGLRVLQACFLPVVALGIAVAPVAGQNFGARLGSRVRETFRSGATMAAALMLAATTACFFGSTAVIRVFSGDPEVIRVGSEYLRILASSFVASGVIFVSSSLFQGMGNTVPPLVASFGRVGVISVSVLVLSRAPGFELRWIWYLSAVTIWLHLVANLLLLRRELRVKLPEVEVV
jgi:putative MATE family efflux protein